MANNRLIPTGQRRRRVLRRGLLLSSLLLGIVLVSGAVQLTDIPWLGALPQAAEESTTDDVVPSEAEAADVIIPRDLAIHPDNIYRRFLSTRSAVSDMRTLDIVRQFQDLLSLFSLRQSRDDNFTLRVLDSRTGGLLELHALDSLREATNSGARNWPEIDRIRRRVTGELVDLYEERGIPRRFVTVKWGRRNQVLEARARDTPFVEHEINLARMHGLSLLATEIGTVETFNDDRVVSRVGARSRYQMMPSVLRDLDVEHYTLKTATGRRVQVREEWHPLIALEAAFIVARAYSNATGHEIPGLSAYHTGPYNVFRIYRQYLNADTTLFTGNSDVVRAYQWGLTDGFHLVSENTSFGNASRGYLPALYGALRATEHVPIDTSLTVMVERVSVRPGSRLLLSTLIDSLETHGLALPWRTPASDTTVYQRFRRLNPHINLPRQADGLSIPVSGNVWLEPKAGRAPVRFFVPRGTTGAFAKAGYNPFDDSKTVAYDHESFRIDERDKVPADREYERLVADIRDFGFTVENRERLNAIYEAMKAAKEADPSYYRWTAAEVSRLHRWVWRSRNFDALAEDVARAQVRITIPRITPAPPPRPLGPRPLRALPTPDLD